jgi:hypothetical protein
MSLRQHGQELGSRVAMNQELRQKKWKVCWQDVVVQPVVATSISPRQIAQESMVDVGGDSFFLGLAVQFLV